MILLFLVIDHLHLNQLLLMYSLILHLLRSLSNFLFLIYYYLYQIIRYCCLILNHQLFLFRFPQFLFKNLMNFIFCLHNFDVKIPLITIDYNYFLNILIKSTGLSNYWFQYHLQTLLLQLHHLGMLIKILPILNVPIKIYKIWK
jgi:hypothetical protein